MFLCWDYLFNCQNILGGLFWYSGILINYEFNDEMVVIKLKCFDEIVLCWIDNLLYRVFNCLFYVGYQSLCYLYRYLGVFFIRFFFNDVWYVIQKRVYWKCSLILNVEIELKLSLLRKDVLMFNDSILLFWGCFESRIIKFYYDDQYGFV